MNPPSLTEIFADVDWLVARMIEQSSRQGRPVTCRAGCSACCSEPLWATRLEALYLLESLTPVQRQAVTDRTRSWLAGARAAGLLAIPYEKLTTHQWLPARLACPFLEGNLCLAYTQRPAGCRTHLAVTPPEYCQPARRRDARTVQSDALPAALAPIVLLASQDTFRHLGAHLARLLLDEEPEDVGMPVASLLGEVAQERDVPIEALLAEAARSFEK
jgi:Fe-S-cluster containining protein